MTEPYSEVAILDFFGHVPKMSSFRQYTAFMFKLWKVVNMNLVSSAAQFLQNRDAFFIAVL